MHCVFHLNPTVKVTGMANEGRLVWDLPLRLFHWLLAFGVVALWATAEAEWMETHLRLGYGMIGLITFRLIWGFVGPRHARFSNFLVGPVTLWRHLQSLASSTAGQSIGHNPLGGIMVVVMIALLAVQAATGLFATDDVVWSGPYNPAVSSATADRLTGLHHFNFNLILAAVVLHIAAIAFYGFVKRQNLAAAMVTGRKPASVVPESEAITSSEIIKAIVALAISGGAVYWIISAAPPPPPMDEYFF